MASSKSDALILAPGHVVGGRFTVIDKLGRGSFWSVYSAEPSAIVNHDTHRLVALKISMPSMVLPFGVSDFEEKLARNEIASLRRE